MMPWRGSITVQFRVPDKYAAKLLEAYEDGDDDKLWEILDRSDMDDLDIDWKYWKGLVADVHG